MPRPASGNLNQCELSIAMGKGAIEDLVRLLSRLPGLGPRSARRAVLHLLQHRTRLLRSLIDTLLRVDESVRVCRECGNFDDRDPCTICIDPERVGSVICVVEEVGDLWALERSGAFRGCYHVLGGRLSALAGVRPSDLNIDGLLSRAEHAQEVILALNPTLEGQTTAHVVMDCLAGSGVAISRLAYGVPFGAELSYLDDGTLATAITARCNLSPTNLLPCASSRLSSPRLASERLASESERLAGPKILSPPVSKTDKEP